MTNYLVLAYGILGLMGMIGFIIIMRSQKKHHAK